MGSADALSPPHSSNVYIAYAPFLSHTTNMFVLCTYMHDMLRAGVFVLAMDTPIAST